MTNAIFNANKIHIIHKIYEGNNKHLFMLFVCNKAFK